MNANTVNKGNRHPAIIEIIEWYLSALVVNMAEDLLRAEISLFKMTRFERDQIKPKRTCMIHICGGVTSGSMFKI